MNKYPGLVRSIIITTAISGMLDLVGAVMSYMMIRRTFPVKILEYIAGGVHGGEALDGSLLMNVQGCLFHFIITGSWTVFFYLLYPHINFLHRSVWLNALIYGIFIWAVMNLLILPLSAWKVPVSPINVKEAAKAAIILILCVGLPIAWRTKTFYKPHT